MLNELFHAATLRLCGLRVGAKNTPYLPAVPVRTARPPAYELARRGAAHPQVQLDIFMAYVHRGGYTVELFRPDPATPGAFQEGSPEVLFTAGADQQALARPLVTMPAEPCVGCLIRVLYSAEEWGASYKFKSCAVIDIVDAEGSDPACPNDCSGLPRCPSRLHV